MTDRTDEFHARRHRRAVAAAGIAILVTGTAFLVVRPSHGSEAGPSSTQSRPGVPTSTPALTSSRTDDDNLRAAAAESTRVLRLAPLPPGAARLPGRPAGWPADAGFGMGPSDQSLTRTAWYAVPLSADQVQAFLLSHVPHGMAPGDGFGNSVGVRTYDYTSTQPREPSAYTGPALLVQWYDLGARTVIRFDAMLASRRARTPGTYLTAAVTSVDIGRTVESHTGRGGTRTLPAVRLGADHDPGGLARLVAALNGLYGVVVSTSMHSCPDQVETTTYRFTFHTGQGEATYRWADTHCDPRIEVTRGGRRITPALDPGDLQDTVTEVLADAPPAG